MALSRAVVNFVNENIDLIDREEFEELFDIASYELTSSDMVLLLHMFLDADIHVFEYVSKDWAEHFAHENKYALREVGISVDDFVSGKIQFKSHTTHPSTYTPDSETSSSRVEVDSDNPAVKASRERQAERERQAVERAKRQEDNLQRYADYRAKKDAEDKAYADKIANTKAAAPAVGPEAPKKKGLSPEEQLHKQMVNAYGKFEELLKRWGTTNGFTTYVLPHMRNLTNEDTELSFGFTLGDGKRIRYKKLGTAKYDQGEYKFDFTSLDAKVPAIKKKIQQEWAYSGVDPKLLK